MEEKKFRNNQTEFRKGKETMDNIRAKFCNRQIAKKEGGMVVMLVDLKVAFDMVNREVLLDSMREKGLREELIGRVGEMVRETKSRIRLGKDREEDFWRQEE